VNLNLRKNCGIKKSWATVLMYDTERKTTFGCPRLTNQVGRGLNFSKGFSFFILLVAGSDDVVDVFHNRLGDFWLVHCVNVNAADSV